jgi:hypothetical protein
VDGSILGLSKNGGWFTCKFYICSKKLKDVASNHGKGTG